jgi:hypothetical protein
LRDGRAARGPAKRGVLDDLLLRYYGALDVNHDFAAGMACFILLDSSGCLWQAEYPAHFDKYFFSRNSSAYIRQ